jgi:hypothetical protein
VPRVPATLLLAVLAGAAGCPASLEDDCPAGSVLVDRFCVPQRLSDPLDDDRDDHAARSGGGDDCDDSAAAVHPHAPEACNGRDDDCDGETDEDVAGVWFRDADGDGHGSAVAPVRGCVAPAGYAAAAGDCDDTDRAVAPGAPETCDGRDQDCDGFTDEGVARRFYRDADGDGYGDAAELVDGCAAPPDYTTTPFDCDEAERDVHPGQELYFEDATDGGGWDYDCDGLETAEPGDVLTGCDSCTEPCTGWLDPPPACGGSGPRLICSWSTGAGCAEASRVPAVRRCR